MRLVRKTKRLVIRPLVLADYRAWRESYEAAGPAKNRWDSVKTAKELTLPAYRRVLAWQRDRRKNDRYYHFGVFERRTGKFVGAVSIMDVLRSVSQSAYLGYFLHHAFWGRGYGKEAALAALDIAFRDLKLHRIEAGIEPQNRRSIMLARAIGLRKEGQKRHAVFLRGQWQDLVTYATTCEEFGIPWRGTIKR